MKIYDELVARGLIAQVTDEEEIKKMINEGKATFYIGFQGNYISFRRMQSIQLRQSHFQSAQHCTFRRDT